MRIESQAEQLELWQAIIVCTKRWGNPGFTEYVKLLEQQADEVLQTASETVHNQAEEAFLKVAELEQYF